MALQQIVWCYRNNKRFTSSEGLSVTHNGFLDDSKPSQEANIILFTQFVVVPLF